MPKKKGKAAEATAYEHPEAKRKNIPEAGLVDYVPKAKENRKEYCWDPRESPQLIWAGKADMRKVEVDEQASIDVPIVNLHIHERVSTEAILRSVRRQDAQKSLFGGDELEGKARLEFYKHNVDWENRMILGDSLVVMNSLLEREGMRGSVQCIYMDPPYGIKYASNFQPRIDDRDVKDKDEDLTREVMQIQAFRDTWELGIHSYLEYLRDRLTIGRELLSDEGSLFFQIGDENVHRARCLLDETFGSDNFCAQITFAKTTGLGTKLLPARCDYLLWYAKDVSKVKYRQVQVRKQEGEEGASQYDWAWRSDGTKERVTPDKPAGQSDRLFHIGDASAMYTTPHLALPVTVQGRIARPPANRQWQTTQDGMRRLDLAGRLLLVGNSLRYVRLLEDFPVGPISNLWQDTGVSGFGESKVYAVQTNTKVLARCILMTTDPGDLVLAQPAEVEPQLSSPSSGGVVGLQRIPVVWLSQSRATA